MPTTKLSKYAATYEYAQAYEDEAWGAASSFAWDRLEMIAAEYERGEYGVARMRELVDQTRADI